MFGRRLIFLAFLGFLSLGLSGCGHRVEDSIPALNMNGKIKGQGPTIVLLPLADYTAGISPDDSLRRQVKLQSALAYRLAEHGLFTPLEEDVVQCLVDLGVIKIIEPPSRGDHSYQLLAREIESGWSNEMKWEINKIIALNKQYHNSDQRMEITKVGLDQGMIQEIGRRFGADYLLRGRIVEYEIRDGHSMNPFRKGILPFFFDLSSATLFGVAESDKYDLWQDLAIGGALGAILGTSANTPFNEPDVETKTVVSGSHPRFATATVRSVKDGGFSNAEGLNAGVWGTAGAAAAYLASKGGKINEGIVQVTLALQDARDGRVIWANRVEKKVAPKSSWEDPSARSQIDTAVEEAARDLINDLANALSVNHVPVVLTGNKDGLPTDQKIEEMEVPETSDSNVDGTGVQSQDPTAWGS